ncbi:MAG: PDZ domain-containing protein [Actinomycetes bacterium]
MRAAFHLVSAGIVLLAALLVPMPLVAFAPGGADDVAELVTIDTETTELSGTYDLLTIRLLQPSLVGTVQALLSPDRELQLRQAVIPDDVDEEDYFRLQQQQFGRAFRTAVAVGASHAGLDVRLQTRPIVLNVLSGGPASGRLEPGDLVLEADGTAVFDADELIATLSMLSPGDRVELVVDRGGEQLDVTVTAQRIPQLDRAGLGIVLETTANDVELPFEAELADTTIGGPSAGMMIALTVFDLLSEVDLAAGRHVAGTGTIDADGNVGPIGGVVEKVAAAETAGADILLVPAAQLEAAQAAAPAGLRVIGVATLADAIDALSAA